MKKTLLILSILLAVSANAFAQNADSSVPLDVPEEVQEPAPDLSPFEAPSKTLTKRLENPEDDIPKDLTPDEDADLQSYHAPAQASNEAQKSVPESWLDAPDENPIVPEKKQKEEVPTIVPKPAMSTSLADKVFWINLINDDEQKIKEWAKVSSSANYLIINKKNCSAAVYDKEGSAIKTFEIGIGRDKGDDPNDTSGLRGKARNTTPAGEYTLAKNVFNKAAYGDLTLSLGSKANKSKKSKKMVALHKVPKFRQERLCKFYDDNLANNRMSHGCINFLEKDFKELTKYIYGGLKVYILPEEEGNHLTLVKDEQGGYEFVQTKYSEQ